MRTMKVTLVGMMALAMVVVIPVKAQERPNGFLLAGTVVYQHTRKLNIQLEGEAAQLAHALPKEQKSEKVLHFNEQEALYQNQLSEDPEETMNMEGGATMMIKMVEPEYRIYTDLENGLQIEQKEFMSRMFLIEKEVEKSAWKITGVQKMILEYPCQEAVLQEEENTVHAWFTPQISVPAGPGEYGNLPGLVLAVEINDGEQVIEAIAVELGEVGKDLMERPKKGKKVTDEEYQAIVAEKMEEMGAEPGAGAGAGHAVMIRIER